MMTSPEEESNCLLMETPVTSLLAHRLRRHGEHNLGGLIGTAGALRGRSVHIPQQASSIANAAPRLSARACHMPSRSRVNVTLVRRPESGHPYQRMEIGFSGFASSVDATFGSRMPGGAVGAETTQHAPPGTTSTGVIAVETVTAASI
jgi:hypothetical protein